MQPRGRRDFLKQAGKQAAVMGSIAMLGANAFGGESAPVVEQAVAPQPEQAPKYHIKFAVLG